MKPKKIWILVGDGARARILETEKLSKELDPVFDYDFVLPQRSSRDIGTDRPASRGGAAGSERHGVAPRVDWHEQAKQDFVINLAKIISDAAEKKIYDKLILVLPPQALGLVRQSLNSAALKKVSHEIVKDFTHLSLHELHGRLKEQM